MTISLPTSPAVSGATPFLVDMGGVLTPFLGGPSQRINRLGTRFGARVTLPPLRSETDGRLFVSRLLQARQDELVMPCPLVDYPSPPAGSPKVGTAVASGSTIPVASLPAGYVVKEGRFFSIGHGGRHWLHMVAADATASGDGVATLGIFPMLRTDLLANDAIELDAPMMQGFVSEGDELNWEIALARRISISFSLRESR